MDALGSYNTSKVGTDCCQSFTLLVIDSAAGLIGGMVGARTWRIFFVGALYVEASHRRMGIGRDLLARLLAERSWKILFVSHLYVETSGRNQGIGRGLLECAEELAQKVGCTIVFLDTFEFEAPEFYRKCGYQQIGQLDVPAGFRRFWFATDLVGSGRKSDLDRSVFKLRNGVGTARTRSLHRGSTGSAQA
jgi:GNAT superfamily N-acetyltransferase